MILRAYAIVTIRHEKAYDFDERKGLWLRRLESEEEIHNILTNAGRVALHTYIYGTPSQRTAGGISGTGFNYIALTDDSGSPAPADTTLAGELSGNGLDRFQGSVTLPTGSETVTTVSNQFTYTGGSSQNVRKTALFDAVSAGKMVHEAAFSERTLNTNDTLTITFNVTLT
jgi:hypothetical protein